MSNQEGNIVSGELGIAGPVKVVELRRSERLWELWLLSATRWSRWCARRFTRKIRDEWVQQAE